MPTFTSILKTHNLVHHNWLEVGEGSLPVYDKFTQEMLAEVPLASAEQMETALVSAEQGFESMRSWSAGQRADHLDALMQALHKNAQAFAELIVAEAGKPISYAHTEIERCLMTLRLAKEEAIRLGGEYIPMDFANGTAKTAFTKRFPVGPIAAISPYNFPLNLVLHKLAPALAVGCSMVLKPPPQAPLSSLALAALCQEVGYPPGALNVLVCEVPVAEKLVQDPRIKLLSFTGSPQVGWHLKNSCGSKKIVLELGGNAAVIVDQGVDIAACAALIAKGAFMYAGQICISTQRIYVHESLYARFLAQLITEIQQLKWGDPRRAEVIGGPLISRLHLERVDSWVKEAVTQGARILTGGEVLNKKANIYAPTLLTDTQPQMKVVCEEVFGPVAIVEKISSFHEGLAAVNQSCFGLQAGVFTPLIRHMQQAHAELEVGAVIINDIPGFRTDSMPYGGIKASGLGREGIKYSLLEMTEPRLLVY